jgi:excinuclease ABC subunit A
MLGPLDQTGGRDGRRHSHKHIGKLQAFSTKRACPVCSTSTELDLFSYNSKLWLVPDCVGTDQRLARTAGRLFVGARDDSGNKGRECFAEPGGRRHQPSAGCAGAWLNRRTRAVQFWAWALPLPLSVTDVPGSKILTGREAGCRDLIPRWNPAGILRWCRFRPSAA